MASTQKGVFSSNFQEDEFRLFHPLKSWKSYRNSISYKKISDAKHIEEAELRLRNSPLAISINNLN